MYTYTLACMSLHSLPPLAYVHTQSHPTHGHKLGKAIKSSLGLQTDLITAVMEAEGLGVLASGTFDGDGISSAGFELKWAFGF